MNKKGFTLIELLAVIIILGILMIIAIPSVTKYISDSRKSAYVDTAKEIIAALRNKVNDGKLGVYDTNTTYYIPISYIKTENSSKSPYGEFTQAYVGVIYNGTGYKYYWISVDDAGEGIKDITIYDELDEEDIVSDLTSEMIENTVKTTGIGNREKILILNPDTEEWIPVEGGAIETITEDGNTLVCKKAKTLHTATCTATADGCYALGYTQGNKGTTITYGTIPNGEPKAGDAYDCKVSMNSGYTERFYFVRKDGDNAIMIYYKNIDGQTAYSYDSSDQNWHGPRTGYQYLPSTSEWNNPKLIAPGTRQIVAQNNTNKTIGGTIESFTYTNKAARFLTIREVGVACKTNSVDEFGVLDNNIFFMENVGMFESDSGLYGYWLETPKYSRTDGIWFIVGYGRRVNDISASSPNYVGVRPVITVKLSDIEQ